jgi:hypothetical protein
MKWIFPLLIVGMLVWYFFKPAPKTELKPSVQLDSLQH